MIDIQTGNILKTKADALVNTVNCVGVMGRGIALQFKNAYPGVFKEYAAACKKEHVQLGKVLVHDLNRLEKPHYVISFPTKGHWRGKSHLNDIQTGLHSLVTEVQRLGIESIAIPPLGCGLGGLDWSRVRPMIEAAFAPLPEVRVLLFEPAGAPAAEAMAKNPVKPKMTEGRAALLGLCRQYLVAVMDPSITLLEIHKLMYFMDAAGQNLKLQWSKGQYGPYAENLRHVLKRIEGHFVSGYGDGADNPKTQIEPFAEAMQQADRYLDEHAEVRERFDRVSGLIDGFETPFGMELLSTVHWVATREHSDTRELIVKVHAWGARKKMFTAEHVAVAQEKLTAQGWI